MLWFKNAIWYRFKPESDLTPERLQEALNSKPFSPCSRHELKRVGWTSPTSGLTDDPVFTSHGFMLICLQQEERILPSSVVRDALADLHQLVACHERPRRRNDVLHRLHDRARHLLDAISHRLHCRRRHVDHRRDRAWDPVAPAPSPATTAPEATIQL